MLFHIIDSPSWAHAREADEYRPDGLNAEGFIHLSTKSQILRPANLLYSGREDLMLLIIDPEKVDSEVVFEPGSHGEDEHFPHLYGPLNLDAVVNVVDFPCEDDGSFTLPPALPS